MKQGRTKQAGKVAPGRKVFCWFISVKGAMGTFLFTGEFSLKIHAFLLPPIDFVLLSHLLISKAVDCLLLLQEKLETSVDVSLCLIYDHRSLDRKRLSDLSGRSQEEFILFYFFIYFY